MIIIHKETTRRYIAAEGRKEEIKQEEEKEEEKKKKKRRIAERVKRICSVARTNQRVVSDESPRVLCGLIKCKAKFLETISPRLCESTDANPR